MKKSILFTAIVALLSLSVAVMAASPIVKVRVVNVSILGEDAVSSADGLVKTATMSVAENPKVFPPVETMVLKVGKDQAKYVPDVTLPAGDLSFSGSLTEEQMLEFISIPNFEGAGKFDGALVSRDGTITYLDEPIVIDYRERSITTPKYFPVKDGDVLLLFTKNMEPISFGHDKVKKEYEDHRDRQPNNPTHGRQK